MTDLFEEKAKDWDFREIPRMISAGVGRALLDNLPLTAELQVMDFGAGTGLVSSHVGPHVDKIYAVDISAAMLEKLVQKPELSGKVEAICQDILETPLNRTFDLIISAMALHHVENTGFRRRIHNRLTLDGPCWPVTRFSFRMVSSVRLSPDSNRQSAPRVIKMSAPLNVGQYQPAQ
tara:strand:+ start:5635 stop:6165 length:531 start_codon:yes stop_codon:yes gene_type:complete